MTTGKVIREKTCTVIDKSTGEVTEEKKETVLQFPKEPSFIKLYLDDIHRLHDIPNNSSGLLFGLLKCMDYEQMINLNSTIKKRIANAAGYKITSLNNYLGVLCKKGIFYHVDRGVYQPNPSLFGKGDWKNIFKERSKLIKVKYDKNGRTIIAG